MKKILIGSGVVLAILAVSLFGLIYLASDHEIPTGETGAPAEALRDKIETAVNLAGYQKLGAIEFTFDTANRRHFYDVQRRLAEIRWDDIVVQYDKNSLSYRVEKNGKQLRGADAAAIFEDAQTFHINDLFWLNPFAHLRSPGVELQKIGEQALLVTFASGGVTPGDSYLIVTDESGKPTHWKIWTQIIPIKGMEFSFDGWQTLGSDIPVSLIHNSFITDVNLSDLEGYEGYPEAGRPDRFAALTGQQ